MIKPVISVVMPVYNVAKYLQDAIDSICRQTLGDFIFIIVDDCSTDNSWDIIKSNSNQDKRIKCFRMEQNSGNAAARNFGISQAPADSEYVAVMDADDIALPMRLEKQVEFLDTHPDIGVISCQLEIINEENKTVFFRNYPVKPEDIEKMIVRFSPLPHPGCVFRKELLIHEKYNEKLKAATDYDLLARLSGKCRFANLDERLIKYRLRADQIKNRRMKETLKTTVKIQKRLLFSKKYFSVFNLIFFLVHCFALCIPNVFLMKIFVAKTYKATAKS